MLDRNDIALLVLAAITLVAGVSYSNWKVSAIGLALDIVGVLLLWRFGLPSHLKPGGKVHTVWDEKIDDVEKKRFDFAKVAGDAAILLIVFGFVLQFIGSV